jgi:hypothetical protein
MKFLKDFGAIVAILLSVIAGAVAYGALSQDVKSHGARLDKAEPVIQQTQTDAAVLKSTVEDMRDSLRRIEDKLGTKR